MIQKQKLVTGATALAFLFLGAAPGVHAQKQEKGKASTREAHVKIIQLENGEHYLLDTTLTLTDGMTLEDAVKIMKERAGSLKNLGAKVIKPVKISSLNRENIVNVFPSTMNDSTRVTFFRTTVPDSIFSKLRASRVYTRDTSGFTIDGKFIEAKTVQAHALRKVADKVYVRELTGSDSLRSKRMIFRIDTTFATRIDSFPLSKSLRVRTLENGSEIVVHRLNKDLNGKVVDPKDFEVIRITTEGSNRIILLKGTKSAKLKAGKKAAKKKIVASDVEVAPNPSNGIFRLSFKEDGKADTKIRIVDSSGKTVFQEEVGVLSGAYSKEIDLSRFGKGLYVVQILMGSKVQSEKVLIQ